MSAIERVEKPTNIKKARMLGYKAKQGFIIVRVRVKKGGRKRKKIRKGRKPKKSGIKKFTTTLSLRAIAERRAAKKYRNLEVLNSYFVKDNGVYKYFEIILVDPKHPQIRSDKDINWICNKRGRVFRGLTYAGRKARGIV